MEIIRQRPSASNRSKKQRWSCVSAQSERFSYGDQPSPPEQGSATGAQGGAAGTGRLPAIPTPTRNAPSPLPVTLAKSRTGAIPLKRLTILLIVAAATTQLFAQAPTAAQLEQHVRAAIPVCSQLELKSEPIERTFPMNMKATLFSAKSASGYCDGDYVAVTTPTGSIFVGMPWFLEGTGSVEQKIKDFAWKALREHVSVEFGKERTRDGLIPVTLVETTARGKVTLTGEIDIEGRVFFLGRFRPMSKPYVDARIDAVKPLLATAPGRGAASPEVTIVEFSDFECPSCKHGAENATASIEKYGDRVRHVRVDLPLVSMHPWALSAAIAGRAIHRQNPAKFWEFKKQVYENQDKLSAFTIDDFAAGFAKDHDLDINRYNTDVNSDQLRDEILRGVGVAFSNDIRSTPSYLVNGVLVEAGEGGKLLTQYVDSLLAKK
jgi:protein-disulfide isomerase